MLKKSILSKINVGKFTKKIIILSIIVYMCIGILLPNNIYADQIKYSYSQGALNQYPGYENLIKNLQSKHPNWSFTILDTGLDWNEAIKNETVASHGRNLIYYTNGGNWVCQTCGNKLYDSGRWKCASESAVAYYMDPRNWLNENNIFQFENLAYNDGIQTVEGVSKILNSVPWAVGDNITYTKTDGTIGVINKSYAQVIMEAAQEAGISPYHLAARIKQEQGSGSTASSTGSGTYSGYSGYYNFLNIKATGANIIVNALQYAKEKGWDDPEKSIKGGAVFISQEYIGRGQSTLYLQKFDVDKSDGTMYYHQYMQNVSAAYTEGNTVRSSYEKMGLLGSSINFVIPVYKNMPQEPSPSPDGVSIVTQNVKVKGDEVSIRDGKSTSCNVIEKVNSGDMLLRIEIASSKENGYYWDKVVMANGSKGYIARNFIEKVEDISNTNMSAVANVSVNLRNGPGTIGTKVITTLTSGQPVTVTEIGKYNGLDGYDWSRVTLSNGTQGYIVSEFLTEVSSTNYIIAYVNCNNDGKVNIRSGVGTNNSIVTSLRKNTKVTVLQKNAGSSNGYNWDKIVTEEGIEGYIANTYLIYNNESSNNGDETNNSGNSTNNNPNDEKNTGESPNNQSGNNNFKVDGGALISEPNTTVADIKKQYSNVKVTNNEKELDDNNLIATGNIVNINGDDYPVIKLGDVNGDGLVKATDYMKIKNHIMGSSKLSELQLKAADVNNDRNIKATDYMKIKNHIMGTSKIEIE